MIFKIAVKSSPKALSDQSNVGKRGVAYQDHRFKIESPSDYIYYIV